MKMKKAIYILAAVLATVACDRENVPSFEVDDEINFDAVGYAPVTKGTSELSTDVTFGATATLNTGGYSYDYFKNAEVAYHTGAPGVWKGVKKLVWPKGLSSYSLDFQCYAPYSASTPWCKLNADGDTLRTNGSITIASFDPTADNYDLMYSDKVTDKTAANSSTGVPVLMNHALASVQLGLNIVRSNDAVVLDEGGRYTYVEWDSETESAQYASTHTSYVVPIGDDPNDLEGIPVASDAEGAEANTDDEVRHGSAYHQHQQFGYRLKNQIQNIWIASLIEGSFEKLADSGSMYMVLKEDGKTWDLPENGVWTIPSTGTAGVAAHSTTVTFFEDKDIEIPPSMLSTNILFPFEIHVVPQALNWSPLTPSNNQVFHGKMKVRQFHYTGHAANDRDDVIDDGAGGEISTGDASVFDYRDIYQYNTDENGHFTSWVTQNSELAPGVTYTNMVWRENVAGATVGTTKEFTPSYEYVVDVTIPLYDPNQFVSTPPQYWKMNTKTVYITRVNFAGHLIEFSPEVVQYTASDVTGGEDD